MQTEHIPPVIEIVPKIEGVRCKMMLFAIYCALTFGPFGVGVWVGYRYDVWVGVAFFLFLTLISGVVSSKMRFSAIPPAQREMNYSTMAIIKWYLAKFICLKN